ncbi:hypothetical protein BKK79_12465 [Cupriavidus sp. USMAA2-4]|uniref:Secreted protein n=1 Tax=Cupriavidus malaysiensis TaxID=367825 RepID=A0ABM6F864_9BURK|nr:hypothetical protein BKK79_12465 [Cupriavidus sp. USMAA2-4]AOZ07793.1 hypothetical protein BKK80_19610 [Cupriavidus malaysiensis]
MILQLRQMRLTEASTFIIFLFLQFLFASLRPEDDPCTRQIIWGQLDGHLVTRKDPDVIHPHFSGDMAQYHMAVLQLHTEGCVGEVFQHLPVHLDDIVFCHT